jgi:predicted GNAT family acetyltransferase
MTETPVAMEHDADRHALRAVLADGRTAGYAHYRKRSEDTYVFDHTVVGDQYEGQGIGSRLARAVVDFARDHDVRVVPQCSFIRAYLREHPEDQDVLADGARLEPDPAD